MMCAWGVVAMVGDGIVVIKYTSIPPNKNPPAAKCFSEKSTNCEVPFLTIQQLLSIHTAVGGFLDQALCSWWIFRIKTSQMVDFH